MLSLAGNLVWLLCGGGFDHSDWSRYTAVELFAAQKGVAVVMPEAQMRIFPLDRSHSLLLKATGSGEPVCYKVGSCWSKGDIKTAEAWFKIVDEQ